MCTVSAVRLVDCNRCRKKFENYVIRTQSNSESISGNKIVVDLHRPHHYLGASVDILRSIGVAFVRLDFVGSKREMLPNRAAMIFFRSLLERKDLSEIQSKATVGRFESPHVLRPTRVGEFLRVPLGFRFRFWRSSWRLVRSGVALAGTVLR